MLNGLGLCTGIGGAELALSEWVRFVCHVEVSPFCQEVLRDKLPAPIWDDVRTFDGKPWRRRVDLVAAGFPCQDLSLAGNRAGLDGERSGLFFEVARIVREVRPSFVFLENVPGIRKYLGEVEREMADAGYECRWDVVSAAEVGAWHLRKRWFCLAADIGSVRGRVQQGRSRRKSWQGKAVDNDDGDKGSLTNALRKRLPQSQGRPEFQPYQQPPVTGSDWWTIEPDVGRVVHGISTRLDRRIRAERIKSLGNSMVPAQAREAFKRLMGLK